MPTVIDTPDVSILHYLERIRVVDDGHISAAMTYLDWQCAFMAMTGYRGMSYGRNETLRPDGDTAQSKGDCWKRLTSQPPAKGQKDFRLGRRHQEVIESAVCIQPISAAMHRPIHEQRQAFVDSLNRLGNLIYEINHFFLEQYKESSYYNLTVATTASAANPITEIA